MSKNIELTKIRRLLTMKKLLVSAVALLASIAAFAVPGIFTGGSGGMTVETGAIKGDIVVGSYFIYDSETLFPSIQATLPMGQIVDGMEAFELSLSVIDDDNLNADTIFSVGAKYVLPIDLYNANVALGGAYSTDDATSKVYAALTYTVDNLPLDITGNLSYSFDAEDASFNMNAEYDFGILQLGVDYINSAGSAFNAYATADIYEGIGATVGVLKIGKKDGDMLTAGLKYSF